MSTFRLVNLPVLVCLFLAPLALAGDAIGWRTDGTGSYPKAQPPLEWSTTKNVVWKTPMPGKSNSLPVLLGNRIFICSEPCTLLCLNRDGKILWQKDSKYDELEIPDDIREKLKVELVEADKIAKKQSALQREAGLLERKLRQDKATKEEMETQLRPLRKQAEDLKKERAKLTLAVLYTQPGTHGDAGYTSPTPVTNGKEVFAIFGNGLAAKFDLDGNRKWLKLVEHSNAAFAHSGSPVLVGDKLIVHYTDLVALDTKTGAEVWRLKHPTRHGTCLATRIGNVDVLLTPNGALVRVQDGKLLSSNLGHCGANSPILHDGSVYYVHGQALATRLPESAEEPMNLKPTWKVNIKGGGYGFSSPVIHDGLIYAATDQGILSVLDASTGKVVYEERLDHDGTTYPSLSQAGNRIYVSSDKGTTIVVQPGREYRELARNKLEPFRSSLVFEGKRMYVRTHKFLYCIGE